MRGNRPGLMMPTYLHKVSQPVGRFPRMVGLAIMVGQAIGRAAPISIGVEIAATAAKGNAPTKTSSVVGLASGVKVEADAVETCAAGAVLDALAQSRPTVGDALPVSAFRGDPIGHDTSFNEGQACPKHLYDRMRGRTHDLHYLDASAAAIL